MKTECTRYRIVPQVRNTVTRVLVFSHENNEHSNERAYECSFFEGLPSTHRVVSSVVAAAAAGAAAVAASAGFAAGGAPADFLGC